MESVIRAPARSFDQLKQWLLEQQPHLADPLARTGCRFSCVEIFGQSQSLQHGFHQQELLSVAFDVRTLFGFWTLEVTFLLFFFTSSWVPVDVYLNIAVNGYYINCIPRSCDPMLPEVLLFRGSVLLTCPDLPFCRNKHQFQELALRRMCIILLAWNRLPC